MSENTTLLREALERIASCDRVVAGDVVDIARQALAAASQEREPEWEYRVVSAGEPFTTPCEREGAALSWLAEMSSALRRISHVERRRKAGEWQRVDDEQPDPQED